MKKQKEIPAMPIVDYDQLSGKMKERAQAMRYWPADTLAEQLMRMAYSVVFIGTYDNKCQMAMDLRTACYQFMANIDAEAPAGYPERELADKIKSIHAKYWKLAKCGGHYKG